jgi:hypothetical protein
MTELGPTRTAPAASVVPTGTLPSFIEWGPVFAGAVLAAALSFLPSARRSGCRPHHPGPVQHCPPE